MMSLKQPTILSNTEAVAKAKALAYALHSEQMDLAGEPYIDHVSTVALITQRLTDNRESAVAVAWLHDLIEDTDMTLEELARQGFSAQIVEAVNQLTHEKGLPYDLYIGDMYSPIAQIVKLADLAHNLDTSRFGSRFKSSPSDLRRISKYRNAISCLAENQDQIQHVYSTYDSIHRDKMHAQK